MAARGSGRPPSRGREITEKQASKQASKNSQSDRSPHSYGHPILGKGAKNICQSKDSIFNQWCQETWKKNVNKSLSIILYKNHFTVGFKVKPENLKIHKENTSKIKV